MIPSHSGCRYALIRSSERRDQLPAIYAVHGVDNLTILASPVSADWADRLAFGRPVVIGRARIVGMAANFKAAYGLQQDLRKEDHGRHEEG